MPDKVCLAVIIDESGSMAPAMDKTIRGYNDYVDSLRDSAVPVEVTLTTFNSEAVRPHYASRGIGEVKKLTAEDYYPRGGTPLYDALGRTLADVERNLSGNPAVLIVVITDGEENASREFTRDSIFNLIGDKTAAGWTFAYLGADQDAWANSSQVGYHAGNTMAYAGADPGVAFRTLRAATHSYMASNMSLGATAQAMPVADFFSNVSGGTDGHTGTGEAGSGAGLVPEQPNTSKARKQRRK